MINKKIIIAAMTTVTVIGGIPIGVYAQNNSMSVENKNYNFNLENQSSQDSISINGYQANNLSNLTSEQLNKELDYLTQLLNFYQKYSGDIKYDVNKDLTNEDIQVRYDEVESKYDLGDTLSLEDEEFITRFDRSGPVDMNDLISQTQDQIDKLTMKGSHNLTSAKTKSFSNEKLEYGLTMRFSGSVTLSKNGSSYSVSIKSTNSCYSNHVATRIPQMNVKSYSLISGGLKVVFDKTLTGSEKSGKGEQSFNKATESYHVTAHSKTTVTPKVKFSTKAGSSTYIDGFK